MKAIAIAALALMLSVSASATSLTSNPWCANGATQDGTMIQQRLHALDAGTFNITVYLLNANASRGDELGGLNGTWSLAGDQITVMIDGETEVITMTITEQSPTGAPQLTLTDVEGSTAFDPCL